MKLLQNTKIKINKKTNDKNISHLETIKVILIHFNIADNFDQQDSRLLCTFVPKTSSVSC